MRHVDATLLKTRLKHPGYELFIIGITFLSIANVVVWLIAADPEVDQIVTIIDGLLCLIFLADFGYRLATAPSRREYMRWGWADLIGSLPIAGLRLFRLVHVAGAMQVLRAAGGRRVVRQLLRERAETAIFLVFLVAIVILELASILVLVAERDAPNANIKTGGDSLWWAWVSVTTVGYGDYYPVTPWGRIFGSILLGVGIGLVTTITGFLATKLLPQRDQPALIEEGVIEASAERADDAPVRPSQG
jgi:voltage-gated potassium channel